MLVRRKKPWEILTEMEDAEKVAPVEMADSEEILDQEKCIMLLVPNAARNVKFRLSQLKASRSFARNVTQRRKDSKLIRIELKPISISIFFIFI